MQRSHYTALATHSCQGPDGRARTLLDELALVRHGLPDRPSAHRSVRTRALATVDDVRRFCVTHDVPMPYRVDYLAPPRAQRRRPGAVSVYLLYVDPTYAGPTHFVLEARLTVGEHTVTYPPCEVGRWQRLPARPERPRQRVTFDVDPESPDEPGWLVLEAYDESDVHTPSVNVSLWFTRRSRPTQVRPTAARSLAAVSRGEHTALSPALR